MKEYIRKAAALLAAAAMAVSAAACGEKKKTENAGTHQDNNLAKIDAPDGDYSDYAERELKPDTSDVPLMITFRAAFATDEEAKKISEFYYAISSKDVKYFEGCVQPDVLKYMLDGSSAQDYLNSEYDFIKDTLIGADFEFSAAAIDDDNTNDDTIYQYDSLLAKAAPDVKPTSKKVFKVNCLYNKIGEKGQLSLASRLQENNMDELQIAVYTIDGKPYIIF